MAKVTVNEELCKGCGLCARACPKKIITIALHQLNTKGYHPAIVTDMEKCIACCSCALTCPDVAIQIEK